jgi:transposase-like protein
VVLAFSLSHRDFEELLAEPGLHADHITVWRWVQRYGPEFMPLAPLQDGFFVFPQRFKHIF